MSKLVKLVYEASTLRADYRRIHGQALGLSARKLKRLFGKQAPDKGPAWAEELEDLLQRLEAARQELADLGPQELYVRRGPELYKALREYVDALLESTRLLGEIVQPEQQEESDSDNLDRLRTIRIAYDDAIQHQKQLGVRLNVLLAEL